MLDCPFLAKLFSVLDISDCVFWFVDDAFRSCDLAKDEFPFKAYQSARPYV